MKNTELRIGNYVQSRIEVGQKWDIIVSANDLIGNYKLFEPILLTEEWLVKFGFITMDAEVDFMEYAKEFEDGSFRFSVFNDGGLDMVNNYPFYITTTGQMKGWETEYKTEFKYVHQLQNLYFCLCGEELILKKD
jgi:hypothetical protein